MAVNVAISGLRRRGARPTQARSSPIAGLRFPHRAIYQTAPSDPWPRRVGLRYLALRARPPADMGGARPASGGAGRVGIGPSGSGTRDLCRDLRCPGRVLGARIGAGHGDRWPALRNPSWRGACRGGFHGRRSGPVSGCPLRLRRRGLTPCRRDNGTGTDWAAPRRVQLLACHPAGAGPALLAGEPGGRALRHAPHSLCRGDTHRHYTSDLRSRLDRLRGRRRPRGRPVSELSRAVLFSGARPAAPAGLPVSASCPASPSAIREWPSWVKSTIPVTSR